MDEAEVVEAEVVIAEVDELTEAELMEAELVEAEIKKEAMMKVDGPVSRNVEAEVEMKDVQRNLSQVSRTDERDELEKMAESEVANSNVSAEVIDALEREKDEFEKTEMTAAKENRAEIEKEENEGTKIKAEKDDESIAEVEDLAESECLETESKIGKKIEKADREDKEEDEMLKELEKLPKEREVWKPRCLMNPASRKLKRIAENPVREASSCFGRNFEPGLIRSRSANSIGVVKFGNPRSEMQLRRCKEVGNEGAENDRKIDGVFEDGDAGKPNVRGDFCFVKIFDKMIEMKLFEEMDYKGGSHGESEQAFFQLVQNELKNKHHEIDEAIRMKEKKIFKRSKMKRAGMSRGGNAKQAFGRRKKRKKEELEVEATLKKKPPDKICFYKIVQNFIAGELYFKLILEGIRFLSVIRLKKSEG